MVKIKINNREISVPSGYTILDAAIEAGIQIPTMCYKKGLPHYSSCMVCMVRDKRNNSFIPSCSAIVSEFMDIDTESEEVFAIRSKSIELLLSEHRAECEAPCQMVCPAGYNIPVLNRLLAAGRIDEALQLTFSEKSNGINHCKNCSAYCENACRRKKIDIPVSIRNLQMYLFGLSGIKEKDHEPFTLKKDKNSPEFRSLIGKLDKTEQDEWLKECDDSRARHREIGSESIAADESSACMHCDCRAASDCQLRNLAKMLKVKDPKGKMINSPIVKKINSTTGLVFENAKCIKCGLCVRECEKYPGEPSLCFIHRGFISIISEPITDDFNNILLTRSKEVVDVCPTGALAIKNDK